MAGGACARQGQLFQLQVAPEVELLPGAGSGQVLVSHLVQHYFKSWQGQAVALSSALLKQRAEGNHYSFNRPGPRTHLFG